MKPLSNDFTWRRRNKVRELMNVDRVVVFVRSRLPRPISTHLFNTKTGLHSELEERLVHVTRK